VRMAVAGRVGGDTGLMVADVTAPGTRRPLTSSSVARGMAGRQG